MIDLALKDSSGKSVVIPVFGYVGFDAKNRLSQHDKVHKDLGKSLGILFFFFFSMTYVMWPFEE